MNGTDLFRSLQTCWLFSQRSSHRSPPGTLWLRVHGAESEIYPRPAVMVLLCHLVLFKRTLINVKTALTTRQCSNCTNLKKVNQPLRSPRKTAVMHDVYLIIQIYNYTLCRVYLDRQMMKNIAWLSKSSMFTCTDTMLNWCPQLYFWRRTSLWQLCNGF